MSYMALYRKFRPTEFDDVKGQDHIATTLQNQIKTDRIGHAYLFTGTRGTGKTTVAKIFAKAVNCESPVDGSPCGKCAMCQAIAAGNSMNVIEIDAASNNGVGNIRDIIEEVTYPPTEGKYKVYIIDEVHMLSIGAFNALLKTLEEPPSYVIFILATTEVHKIPITILSRCQRYDFHRISIDTIADRLTDLMQQENIDVEEKAIRYIAKAGDGSMRDALSLLDQCIAFYFGQELTYDKVLDVLGAVDTAVFSQMLRAILDSDVTSALKILEEMVIQGRELNSFVTDMTWYLRNLLLLKTADANEEVIDVSSDNMIKLKEEAAMVDHEIIMRYIRVMSELSGQIKYATQKRILVEVALIKLCIPSMECDSESVLDRIRVIETKLEKGIVVSSSQIAGGSGQTGGAPSVNEPKIAKEITKALPEDIKYVVAHWGEIVSYDETLGRYLSETYPSIGDNDTLIVVAKENFVYNRFTSPAFKDDIKNIIAAVTNKDMVVSLVMADDGGVTDATYPDVRAFVDTQIDFEIDEISEDEIDDYEIEERDDNG